MSQLYNFRQYFCPGSQMVHWNISRICLRHVWSWKKRKFLECTFNTSFYNVTHAIIRQRVNFQLRSITLLYEYVPRLGKTGPTACQNRLIRDDTTRPTACPNRFIRDDTTRPTACPNRLIRDDTTIPTACPNRLIRDDETRPNACPHRLIMDDNFRLIWNCL